MPRDWIQKRLDELNGTQAGLAKAMGLPAPRVSEIIGGKREVKVSEIPAMARFLQLDAGQLALKLAGEPGARAVPLQALWVRAAVQAGHWTEDTIWPEDDWYTVPMPTEDSRYPGMELHGIEVRGTSMNLLYPAGTVLAYIHLIQNPVNVRPGAKVIVQRRNNRGEIESTVKEIQQDEQGRIWLWPRSSDPEHQAPLRANEGHEEGSDVQIIGLVVRSSKPE